MTSSTRCGSRRGRKAPMVDATPTLGDLFAASADEFRRAGMTGPRREALQLWADLTGVNIASAALAVGEPVDAESANRLSLAVRRRIAGEPVAYVAGWTGFRHLRLQCDRRALIPR